MLLHAPVKHEASSRRHVAREDKAGRRTQGGMEEEAAAVWDRRAYAVMSWGEAGDEGMDMLTAAVFVCERSCGLSALAVTPASLSLPFSLCVPVCVRLGATAARYKS